MRPVFHLAFATAVMSLAAMPAARAQDDAAYMVTYLEVVPSAKGPAATLLKQLADASRKESGVMRFEVFQRTTPSNQFLILEVWKDKAAMEAHGSGAAAKIYREKMQPNALAPIDD